MRSLLRAQLLAALARPGKVVSNRRCVDAKVSATPAGRGVTMISVVAPDRVGVLASITGAFEALGCDILAARVRSVGGEARDSFLVGPPFALERFIGILSGEASVR